MKHQAPTSKHQRSTKHQAPKAIGAVAYPEANSNAMSLKDGPISNGDGKHPFDLEERTARFGEAIIRFVKKIPHKTENKRLIDQLVGCGTSVGRTIARRTKASRTRISKTPSDAASRKRRKRSSSFAWSRHPNRRWQMRRANFIAKLRNCI